MLQLEQLEFGKGWKLPESSQSRSGRRIGGRAVIKSTRSSKMPSTKNKDIVTWPGDLRSDNGFQNNYSCQVELQNRLHIRSSICCFLIKALGWSIACCFCIIFLNGFHPFGFEADATLVKWLCAVTVAKLAVLLAIFVKESWQKTPK